MHKMKKIVAALFVIAALLAMAIPAFAAGNGSAPAPDAAQTQQSESAQTDSSLGLKAVATGIAIGFGAGGGAIGMGIAAGKSVEGIARQPEAESKIRTTLMLGLVFIETAIIYALLVVILIIFVL
mgnify:FL=1